MRIIEETSPEAVHLSDPAAMEIIAEVIAAGNADAFNSILDTLWAPEGMTREQWSKFLIKDRDHILARFGKH